MDFAINTMFAMQNLAMGAGPVPPTTPMPPALDGSSAAPDSFAKVFAARDVGGNNSVSAALDAGPLGAFDFAGQKARIDAQLGQIQASQVSDPSIQALRESGADFMKLQLQVQDFALRAEMASKLAEHTTSSTKTVLQTQA